MKLVGEVDYTPFEYVTTGSLGDHILTVDGALIDDREKFFEQVEFSDASIDYVDFTDDEKDFLGGITETIAESYFDYDGYNTTMWHGRFRGWELIYENEDSLKAMLSGSNFVALLLDSDDVASEFLDSWENYYSSIIQQIFELDFDYYQELKQDALTA